MSFFEIISKISICLFIAALLGFVVGWLFSRLKSKETRDQKYQTLYEEYELKLSDIKQFQEELLHKDEHIERLEQKYRECEKERLNAQMEETSCDRYLRQIKELESENDMLISQIKEQKLCEDENQLLKDELKILEEEKEQLLEKIEACRDYEQNYKDLILQVEALKSERDKLLSQAQQSTRIFTEETTPQNYPADFESIKADLLHLQEEVKKLKSQKERLRQKVQTLRKKLSRKKNALQTCHKQLQQKLKSTDTQTPESASFSEPIHDLEEIKTLSQLIRDTLNDIQK